MTFDFDAVIDRAGTAAIATESFREFLLGADPNVSLPVPDDQMLSMWVADMDFAAPDAAIDAIQARLDRRIFGYTVNDHRDYKRTFARWCRDRYDWTFNLDHHFVAQGVVPTLISLVEYFCLPGDKVLTTTPAYHWFEEAVELNDIELVTAPLIDDGGYRVDFSALRTLAEDPAVRMFFLCHPHNPTGRQWTNDELVEMAQICFDNDVLVVSDEVHCDLLRQGRSHTPLAKLFPDSDQIVTCMAPSKTFNLAGMMLSNVIIPNDDLRHVWSERELGVGHPLSLAAATGVYSGGHEWLDACRTYLDDNLALVASHLATQVPGARFSIPEATYLAWIDLSAVLPDVEDLTMFFATKAGVLLEGPENFVADAHGWVRLNVACPRAKVQQALDQMTAAIAATQG